MGNIDYDDPDGLIKDFQYFYTNSISVLEKREVKLSVYAFISPVIYFKWCDDDQLIWGLDSRFFQYDEIASLLSYKEADKYVDPHSILHGIQKSMKRSGTRGMPIAKRYFFFCTCGAILTEMQKQSYYSSNMKQVFFTIFAARITFMMLL